MNDKIKCIFHIGDCLKLFKKIENDSISMIFADPPYNLNKKYYSVNDSRPDYFEWVKKWIEESFRVLKPGGSAYFMNAPKNFGRQETIITTAGFKILNYIIWMRRNPAPSKMFIQI